MNGQEIINLGRELSGYTDTSEYTNEKALLDANIAYKDLVAQINQDVNEDLYADDFYTTSIQGQLEYTLPITDNSNQIAGIDNLLGVYINYQTPVNCAGTVSTTALSEQIIGTGTNFSSDFVVGDHIIIEGQDFYRIVSIIDDTHMIIAGIIDIPQSNQTGLTYQKHEVKYVKCYPERISNLEFDQMYYGENQPKETPFYIKYDTGVRIYPFASETIAGAIKFFGTKDALDLKLDTYPVIDDNWHYVIAYGMSRLAYARRLMKQEAIQAYQDYIVEYNKVKNTLSESDISPLNRHILTLNEFQ